MKTFHIAALCAFTVAALSLGACASKQASTTTTGTYQQSTYSK